MNVRKITQRVHYIGVNDRTTQLFEGLWPLPFGVSYNSYLVTGSEKTAIIDGVEIGHALEQIDNIKRLLGDRKPDYLVINHMEPDHSGAISVLRNVWPDLTIVGNPQTLGMVKGFYGHADPVLTVKDGDRLDLGNATLRFVTTPMVHWPETMMTLLEEEGVLFSGDAFGCFGALNGGVADTEMDTALYFPEMERYYSNIVGKYGAFVQKALAKLKDVAIEAICSTHGPVWKQLIPEVTGLYNRLSLYEPLDNGVTIVYGSMYGNTQKLVEAVAQGLAEGGVRNIRIHNASVSNQSHMIADAFRHKGLIVASPTYSEKVFPPVQQFLSGLTTRGLKNRITAALGSFTWVAKAGPSVSAQLEEMGLGSQEPLLMMKQSPDQDLLEQARQLGLRLAAQL